jgi:hypothetical protein
MRPRFASLLLPFVAALFLVSFGACQNEGEGEPCDTNAGNGGNDDCRSPFVCTVGLNNAMDARCCPQDRANATTPECSLSSATFDGASPAPPDASTPDTSSPEAASPEAATLEAATLEGATPEAASTEAATAEAAVPEGAAAESSTDAPAEGAIDAAPTSDGSAVEAGD